MMLAEASQEQEQILAQRLLTGTSINPVQIYESSGPPL